MARVGSGQGDWECEGIVAKERALIEWGNVPLIEWGTNTSNGECESMLTWWQKQADPCRWGQRRRPKNQTSPGQAVDRGEAGIRGLRIIVFDRFRSGMGDRDRTGTGSPVTTLVDGDGTRK